MPCDAKKKINVGVVVNQHADGEEYEDTSVYQVLKIIHSVQLMLIGTKILEEAKNYQVL